VSRRVEIQIDELVLDGFNWRERYAIGEAIEREITRLFASDRLQGLRTAAHIDAGVFKAASAKPQVVGTEAARAIHRGIRQ